MIIKYSFLVILCISTVISCAEKTKDVGFDKFSEEFISDLVDRKAYELKKIFASEVYIHGFGELSYKLVDKNDFDGYSAKKGNLYIVLFETSNTKNVYGYSIKCFAESFMSSKDITRGHGEKGFYYMHAKHDGIEYTFAFKKQGTMFKLWDLEIAEL